ncbi:MAG TPA: hypothetical protein VKM56_14735 [Verrucomicrobiae bacterium]|nr:hypothetical protein [Verrucomicrobiae bacterium]
MEYEHLFWAEMLAGGIRFGNRSQGRFVWQIALKICLTNLMPDNLKPLIEGFEKVAPRLSANSVTDIDVGLNRGEKNSFVVALECKAELVFIVNCDQCLRWFGAMARNSLIEMLLVSSDKIAGEAAWLQTFPLNRGKA